MNELYYSDHLKDMARAAVKKLIKNEATPPFGGLDDSVSMRFDTQQTDRGATLIVTMPDVTVCADKAAQFAGQMERALSMPVDVSFASS